MPPVLKPLKNESISQNEKRLEEAHKKAFGDLNKVEVKLSDKFFWWESPTVCRWEPWEESVEFAAMDPKTQDYNLNYDDHVEKESKKLFSAPDPKLYKQKIQLKDFDLASPHKDLKLFALVKNYLAPMMPAEFKLFNEQLKIFKRKQAEWKWILEEKKELAAGEQSTIDTARAKVDVRDLTVQEFHKMFDKKTLEPRNLFPIEHCKLIEVLEDREMVKEVQESRDKRKLGEDEDVDIGLKRPVKDESLLLSEFLQQVENVKESLRPFFRQLEVTGNSMATRQKSDEVLAEKKLKIGSRSRQSSIGISSGTRKLSTESKKPKPQLNAPSMQESPEFPNDKIDLQSIEAPTKLIPHHKGKWSTRDIYEQSYDPATKVVTFYTGRLGTFGLATSKYCNLPLRTWEMFPVIKSDNEKFVMLKISAQHATVEFKITNGGYTFNITSPKKPPTQGITEPVKVFELKKILRELNLNMFPEVDASWYVEGNCEKHKAMEIHTYKSMAVYCLSHHFKPSEWNRFAHRRVAILESRMIDKKIFKRLMVTPLRTASVNIREACTALDVVKLDYQMDPPEQDVSI